MDRIKKRNLTIGIVVLFALLIALTSRPEAADEEVEYAEALFGEFVVSIQVAGTLEPENSTEIKGPNIENNRNIRAQSLTISDIVSEGTTVKKGDYVAMLDRTEFQNTLTNYQESLTDLLLNHESLLLDSAVTLSGLRDDIVNQEHSVDNTRTTLINSQYESVGTIRTAELNLQREENTLEQLRKSYDLSMRKILINIQNSRNDINDMRDRISDYQEILDAFYITAPADGMVVYAKDYSGNKIKSGSSVSLHDCCVATLPDLSSMLSMVHVSEIDINKVETGMNVQIVVDAYPSKKFTGKVIKVAKVGETLSNSETKVFEVYIMMDKVDSQLRPDMTTTNTVQIAKYSEAVYIPSACVHTGADSVTVVYTKSGRKQVVVLGASNSEQTIIKEGIEPGEVLYVTMPKKVDSFKLRGEELIEVIRQENALNSESDNNYTGTEIMGVAGL